MAIERAAADALAGGRDVVDIAALEERVELAALERMAVSRGEWIEGSVGLSVPIGRHGDDVATLSIYGPAFRMSEDTVEDYVAQLADAAKAISMAWRK
jgi:DNA-binding IclR family transcriptional regulator